MAPPAAAANLGSNLSPHDLPRPASAPPPEPEVELTPEELAADQAGDSESGKFRQLFGILKKCLNVANLNEVRISLPANLLEPIVTKDLKFVKHKVGTAPLVSSPSHRLTPLSPQIAKPYNSVLGEHFHSHWDVDPVSLHPTTLAPEPTVYLDTSPTPEVLSNAGRPPLSSSSRKLATTLAPSTSSLPNPTSSSASSSGASAATVETQATSLFPAGEGQTRTVFLNEQTSHHPPISFFALEARGPKGTVRATGADQVGAKFTGTTVKVFPGERNKGIFVTLPDRENEEYQITHPTANVAGLLRGSPYATICEHSYITCRPGPDGKRLRCILAYTEESWLMKSKFLVEGVIYTYEEGQESTYTKIKHVPTAAIVATLSGCWRGEIRWKRAGAKDWTQLLDMVPLAVVPKTVAPLEVQHDLETRKVWSAVTTALLAKDWNAASKAKQILEQAQRVKAEERKKSGVAYYPLHFEPEGEEWDGRPVLTDAGRAAIEKEFKARYDGPTSA
ncbi:hypothetical protein RQP46_007317 [Phenoliferia psychrophenolica]